MRRRWILSVGGLGVGTLVIGGAATLALLPPAAEFKEVQLDGQRLATVVVPRVSPQPHLLIRVNRALAFNEWQLSLDGRRLQVPAFTTRQSVLDVTLPGPLPLGSHHYVEVLAGRVKANLAFRVVPPLEASIDMRLSNLHADGASATVVTTLNFSRPVIDRDKAQQHLHVTGATESDYSWLDSESLQAVAKGLPLGSRSEVILDPGISGDDGSYTTRASTASLLIPTSVTQVQRGRMVQMYYVNTPDGKASFFNHLAQIDMLSPGWYDANADATLTGYARRDVIDAAHDHGIQIVPLVVNADVDPDVAHSILADEGKRKTLAANLVNEATTYGYAGFQLDFEQVRWTDRDLLTQLVRDCAAVFRPAGLSLSIAVIPRLTGDDTASGALLDYFQSWSGAYDFVELAKAADFLSFMTYDEHNGVTPPGPVSGIPWMRRALEFSLQGVPPEKATLGLPTYYHDWTGVGHLTSSSHEDALILAKRYRVTPTFEPTEDEMHFDYTTAAGVLHELWFENGETLRRKLPLLYEYGLKGISVWRLGFEDPGFWSLIPTRR
jgi:spore germination protein YaaH